MDLGQPKSVAPGPGCSESDPARTVVVLNLNLSVTEK